MSKMKKCKHCQSDIPKKATVCPVCKKKQNKPALGAILILFGIIIIICALSGSDDSNTTNGSSVQNTEVSGTTSIATKLTVEKYNAIDFGMSYEDVVAIIGEEGENISEVSVADVTTSIYQWDEGLANFNVTIQDNQVTAKAQAGVIVSSSKVTMEMYNSIENGMTYDEVVEIFGAEGAPLSTAKTLGMVTTIYTWNGTSLGANCNVTFQDGVVFAKAQYGLE